MIGKTRQLGTVLTDINYFMLLFESMRALLLSLLLTRAVADDVILKPVDGKSDPEVALYFAQGADIETQQYTDIMSQLQKQVPFKLWIGIVQCQSNVCSIPTTLAKGCARVEEDMTKAGMNAQKTFYGGHSLGGTYVNVYSFLRTFFCLLSLTYIVIYIFSLI